MSHLFEPASTGRSKCRGCAKAIAKGELRFGERLPNPFAEGEQTLWFHPLCAAYKRPEPLLETLGASVPDREALERTARASAAHKRVPRIDGAERSPTSQARCRECKQPIEKGAWRIRLVWYEEGRFTPSGYVHLACREAYFETTDDVLAQVLHFSGALGDADREDLKRAWATGPQP
jgi:hypothetical protein